MSSKRDSPASSTTFAPSPTFNEKGDKASIQSHPVHVERSDIVDWEYEDEANPRNWKNNKRWTVTVIVSLFTFIR
jgi:hypothetical protein